MATEWARVIPWEEFSPNKKPIYRGLPSDFVLQVRHDGEWWLMGERNKEAKHTLENRQAKMERTIAEAVAADREKREATIAMETHPDGGVVLKMHLGRRLLWDEFRKLQPGSATPPEPDSQPDTAPQTPGDSEKIALAKRAVAGLRREQGQLRTAAREHRRSYDENMDKSESLTSANHSFRAAIFEGIARHDKAALDGIRTLISQLDGDIESIERPHKLGRFAEPESGICRECDDPTTPGWFVCTDCMEWTNRIEHAGDQTSVRCEGKHYTITDRRGKRARIRRWLNAKQMSAGWESEIEVSTLRCDGPIPWRFKGRLPDNAVVTEL